MLLTCQLCLNSFKTYDKKRKYCSIKCCGLNRTSKTGINLDFFQFNKPEYAYLIGFLWADGCLLLDSKLSAEFLSSDAEKLEQIFILCGSWSKSTRHRKNRQPQTTYSIFPQKDLNQFQQLDFLDDSGLAPTKIIDKIPKSLHYMFFRGYIDGDGSWYFNPEIHAKSFNISGQYNQDWSFVEDKFKTLKIDYSIQRMIRKNGYQHSSIIVGNMKSLTNLYNYLYPTWDHIGLPRKHDKALSIINSDIKSRIH